MALCQPWFRASVDQVDPSLPTAPFQPPSCIQIHRFCQKYAGNAPPGDVHAVASDRQYKVLLTIPKKIVNGWNSDTSKGFGHLVGSKHPVLRLGDVRWTKSSRHPEQQKARNGKATMPVDGAMFCLEVMPSHPGESSFDVVRPMNTEHSPFDKSSEGNLRWLDEEGAMRDWMSAVGSQDSNASFAFQTQAPVPDPNYSMTQTSSHNSSLRSDLSEVALELPPAPAPASRMTLEGLLDQYQPRNAAGEKLWQHPGWDTPPCIPADVWARFQAQEAGNSQDGSGSLPSPAGSNRNVVDRLQASNVSGHGLNTPRHTEHSGSDASLGSDDLRGQVGSSGFEPSIPVAAPSFAREEDVKPGFGEPPLWWGLQPPLTASKAPPARQDGRPPRFCNADDFMDEDAGVPTVGMSNLDGPQASSSRASTPWDDQELGSDELSPHSNGRRRALQYAAQKRRASFDDDANNEHENLFAHQRQTKKKLNLRGASLPPSSEGPPSSPARAADAKHQRTQSSSAAVQRSSAAAAAEKLIPTSKAQVARRAAAQRKPQYSLSSPTASPEPQDPPDAEASGADDDAPEASQEMEEGRDPNLGIAGFEPAIHMINESLGDLSNCDRASEPQVEGNPGYLSFVNATGPHLGSGGDEVEDAMHIDHPRPKLVAASPPPSSASGKPAARPASTETLAPVTQGGLQTQHETQLDQDRERRAGSAEAAPEKRSEVIDLVPVVLRPTTVVEATNAGDAGPTPVSLPVERSVPVPVDGPSVSAAAPNSRPLLRTDVPGVVERQKGPSIEQPSAVMTTTGPPFGRPSENANTTGKIHGAGSAGPVPQPRSGRTVSKGKRGLGETPTCDPNLVPADVMGAQAQAAKSTPERREALEGVNTPTPATLSKSLQRRVEWVWPEHAKPARKTMDEVNELLGLTLSKPRTSDHR